MTTSEGESVSHVSIIRELSMQANDVVVSSWAELMNALHDIPRTVFQSTGLILFTVAWPTIRGGWKPVSKDSVETM